MVSIIIPTCNRCAALRQTLDALRAQTYPAQKIEVIVVADGCTDGTVQMLQGYKAPYTMHLIDQPNRGPAAARNQGVAQARGEILIFLDDDVRAAPLLVETHVKAHADQSDRVVVGYLPPCVQVSTGFFRIELQGWWENMFQPMRQQGYRYGYWNLLSGNFSLKASLFARVSGFDTAFRCHEDYELGVRLIKNGISMFFAQDALGYHHETTDLNGSLQRKRQEGRADLMMVSRHPELWPATPLAYVEQPRSFLNRWLRRMVFVWPVGSDAFAAVLQRILDLLEYLRLRGRWRRLLYELLDYWYWRGVVDELGSRQALADFLQRHSNHTHDDLPEMELDLRQGLDAAEQQLDIERPASLRLWYGQLPIGYIPPRPGAERLRGVHLRRLLATEYAWSMVKALALERTAKQTDDSSHLLSRFLVKYQDVL